MPPFTEGSSHALATITLLATEIIAYMLKELMIFELLKQIIHCYKIQIKKITCSWILGSISLSEH
jgi:hypothetical protein